MENLFTVLKRTNPFFILLAGILCLASCQPSPGKSAAAPSKTDSLAGKRALLIKELKKLQATIENREKNAIGQLFHFPIPDSMASVFVDDTLFYHQRDQAGGITRQLFDIYFPLIATSLGLDEFKQTFRSLDLDQLQDKDSIAFEDIRKDQPCAHQYSIRIENNRTVTIAYGTNQAKDFKPRTEDERDMIEMGGCEHQTWWIFDWDGKTLTLEKESGAD